MHELTYEQVKVLFRPLFYQIKDWIKLVNVDPLAKKEAITKIDESLTSYLALAYDKAPDKLEHHLNKFLMSEDKTVPSFDKDLSGIAGLLTNDDRNFVFLNSKLLQVLREFLKDISTLLPKGRG